MAVGEESDDQGAVDARVAELKAALTERDAKIAALSKQVELLTELLSRNSKNSHLPPSSDGPGSSGSAAGQRKPKSDRKRGGQKGHRGSYRELLPAERVDTFVTCSRAYAWAARTRCRKSSTSTRFVISSWSCVTTGRI